MCCPGQACPACHAPASPPGGRAQATRTQPRGGENGGGAALPAPWNKKFAVDGRDRTVKGEVSRAGVGGVPPRRTRGRAPAKIARVIFARASPRRAGAMEGAGAQPRGNDGGRPPAAPSGAPPTRWQRSAPALIFPSYAPFTALLPPHCPHLLHKLVTFLWRFVPEQLDKRGQLSRDILRLVTPR